MQHTLQKEIEIVGIGLHSGRDVTLRICPAQADSGIVFVRTDVKNCDNLIPARWDRVVDTQLCTVIANEAGVRVGTIEHLMSALRGAGIDNARIEVNAPELPVLDGSAQPFIEAIDEVGLEKQDAPRRAIKVLKPVSVERDGKIVKLRPAMASIFAGELQYDDDHIGTQGYQVSLVNGFYRHDIAAARTFCYRHEVEYMRSQGLALGGSLDNAVVVDKEEGVLNEEGLRFEDEFIRHKILDAIGDLYLAGAPILGVYEGVKIGHAMNNAILRELFSDPENWEYVELLVDLNEEDAVYEPACYAHAKEKSDVVGRS